MLHEGLANLLSRVAAMNQYVDQQAPWKLAKDPARRAELEETLATLIYVIASVARCLSPFIPEKSAELWKQLGAPGRVDEPGSLGKLIEPKGWRVKKGDALFPKTEGERT
jgi:methionyl-tRNA synthetase